jgi:trimeric autotransporter adhesin
MPNTASASTPTAFAGVFTGVPNNGTIPVALVDGAATGLRYNLVGNPYPSPISIATLVADNAANIETTLYFWRKTNGTTGTAYCTYNTAGMPLFTSNGNAQAVDPLGVIQTGQGFFVEAKSGATSLTFNNGQRIANNAGQFFKTKQVAAPSRI